MLPSLFRCRIAQLFTAYKRFISKVHLDSGQPVAHDHCQEESKEGLKDGAVLTAKQVKVNTDGVLNRKKALY